MSVQIHDQLTRRPVAALAPYARNSRTHSPEQVDQLVASIREWGWTNPILIDEHGGIIAGHGRILAAQQMGLEEVPCLTISGLSAEQKRAYVIADNQLALNAGWDADLLAAELRDLAAADYNIEPIGFSAEELAELDLDLEAFNGEPDEAPGDTEPELDRAEELRAQWGVELGQLWQLGEHRLLCGDSTSAEDVARLMTGEIVDMCFTSPPYGAAKVAKLRDHYVRGAAKRQSFYDQHEDDPGSWPDLMNGWFATFRPVSECVICNVQMLADNKRALARWLADRSDDLVDVIVWDKINAAPQMQSNVLSNAFEFCFVFGGNASRSIPFADFHGTISNVVRIDPRGKNDQADKHRAVFPIELPTWFMESLCRKAKTVADPFNGTGTTLIAAENIGRKCYAMEISPAYVAVTLQRWADHTGRTPQLLTTEASA